MKTATYHRIIILLLAGLSGSAAAVAGSLQNDLERSMHAEQLRLIETGIRDSLIRETETANKETQRSGQDAEESYAHDDHTVITPFPLKRVSYPR